FFSSRRRHTRSYGDWSSDVCSSDLKRRSLPQHPAKHLKPILMAAARASRSTLTLTRADSGIRYRPTEEDFWSPLKRTSETDRLRSEERRVGKECRARW